MIPKQVVVHRHGDSGINSTAPWLKKTDQAGVTHIFQRDSKNNTEKMKKFFTKVNNLFSNIKKFDKSSIFSRLQTNDASHIGRISKAKSDQVLRSIHSQLKSNSNLGAPPPSEILIQGYNIRFSNEEYKA
jgi:hypothetical protein